MGAMRNQKRVLLVVGGIIALLAVAAATVFLLTKLNGTQTSQSQDNSSSEPVATSELISGVRSNLPSSVSSLSERQAADGQFKITVKISGKPFTVAISPDATLWMVQGEKKEISNAQAVLSDAKTYFESKGMREMLASPSSISFESNIAVCQVQVIAGETGGVLYGCASSDVAKAEYEAIAKLIGLYNQANVDAPLVQTTFANAERTVQERDSVKGAILSLLPNASATTGKVLLYGALGETWEYVADVTTGNSSGKANVPDAALPLIKDKKWNGVLAGLVGVE